MKEFLESHNVADAPTPISSAGAPTQGYGNASGEFDLEKELRRKIKSRKNLSQSKGGPAKSLPNKTLPEYQEGPLATGGSQQDNSTDRYFGSFSIEAKRNVMDLLKTHPEFGQKGGVRMNRVGNNTREVMPKDPTKVVENGGYMIYENQPQASQKTYDSKTK
jgi:hypothetical protein